MDIIKNILAPLSSSFAAIAIPVLIASGYFILNKMYKAFDVSGMLKDKGLTYGNEGGLKTKEVVLDKIKDKKLYDYVLNDFDSTGNMLDLGFDLGIRGIKVDVIRLKAEGDSYISELKTQLDALRQGE